MGNLKIHKPICFSHCNRPWSFLIQDVNSYDIKSIFSPPVHIAACPPMRLPAWSACAPIAHPSVCLSVSLSLCRIVELHFLLQMLCYKGNIWSLYFTGGSHAIWENSTTSRGGRTSSWKVSYYNLLHALFFTFPFSGKNLLTWVVGGSAILVSPLDNYWGDTRYLFQLALPHWEIKSRLTASAQLFANAPRLQTHRQNGSAVREDTDGQTDGCYQAHYFPASRSIIRISIFQTHPKIQVCRYLTTCGVKWGIAISG